MAENNILAQLGIEVNDYEAEHEVSEIIDKLRQVLNQTLGLNIDVGDIEKINQTLDETGTKVQVVFDNANNSIRQVSATIKDADNVTTRWVQNFSKISDIDWSNVDIDKLDPDYFNELRQNNPTKYTATSGQTSVVQTDDLKDAVDLVNQYYTLLKQLQSVDTDKFSNWANVLQSGVNNLLPDMQNLRKYLEDAGVSFSNVATKSEGITQTIASYDGVSTKIQDIVKAFNKWQDVLTEVQTKKLDADNYEQINRSVKETTNAVNELYKAQSKLISYKGSDDSNEFNVLSQNVQNAKEKVDALVQSFQDLTGAILTQNTNASNITTITAQYDGENEAVKRLVKSLENLNDAQNLKQAKHDDVADTTKIKEAVQTYKDLQEAILDYKKAYSDINVGSSTLADMSKKVDDLKQAWQEAESKILSGGKAVRENSDYMKQASAVTDEYAKKTRDLGKSIENSNSGFRGNADSMADAIAQSAIYAVSLDNLMNAMQSVVDTAHELDDAMTDIQIVTQMSNEDATALMQSYSQIAKELGSTTTAVAESADEWLNV